MHKFIKRAALTALLLLLLVGAATAQSGVADKVKAKVRAAKSQVDSVTVFDLERLIAEQNTLLLDVRTEAEHRAGHIPGARWVPRGMLEFVAMRDSLAPTDARIVLYRKKDGRGSLAAQTLQELGYQHVAYVVGGYDTWLMEGYPVDSGMSPVTFTGGGAMKLTSPAFAEGEMIPAKYTCDEADISPKLLIEDVPAEAVSLALICDDPDAPMGTWVHWVLYNLPPGTEELHESYPTDAELPHGIRQGVTDFGDTGYGGPCPPSGTHRYFFKLYALDSMLEVAGKATKADLLAAMEGHIIAEAQLMGKYSRR